MAWALCTVARATCQLLEKRTGTSPQGSQPKNRRVTTRGLASRTVQPLQTGAHLPHRSHVRVLEAMVMVPQSPSSRTQTRPAIEFHPTFCDSGQGLLCPGGWWRSGQPDRKAPLVRSCWCGSLFVRGACTYPVWSVQTSVALKMCLVLKGPSF